MKSSKDVINALNNGELPDELNFNVANSSAIDWTKVQYQTFWRDPYFWASKYPNGWQSIPGFEAIFEQMALNAKSPLEEILDRKNLAHDIDGQKS